MKERDELHIDPNEPLQRASDELREIQAPLALKKKLLENDFSVARVARWILPRAAIVGIPALLLLVLVLPQVSEKNSGLSSQSTQLMSDSEVDQLLTELYLEFSLARELNEQDLSSEENIL